jgi:hypothetical protein
MRSSSGSTHIQGHRGRIGPTGIASPSTALAPPSLACPLPPVCFAIAPCKTTESFHSFPYPTSPPYPRPRYRYRRCVCGEIPTLSYEGYFLLHPQSSWARRIRSTSATVPTTPLTVIIRACVRVCPHSFSLIRGAIYLGTYLTSNRLLL